MAGQKVLRGYIVEILASPFSSYVALVISDPVGLLGTKAFLCPLFPIVGNRLYSATKTFPDFQRAGSNTC